MAEHLVYLTVDSLDVKWAASMAESTVARMAALMADLMVAQTAAR